MTRAECDSSTSYIYLEALCSK